MPGRDASVRCCLAPGFPSLDEYVGQTKHRANLKVFVEAARRREEPLDHVLLSGPPGLGKTTLANILAREMGVTMHATSGPAIEHKGALAGLLTKLESRDVLFIDEIHRLSPVVEESLYPAIESFQIDIMTGESPCFPDYEARNNRPSARISRGMSGRDEVGEGKMGVRVHPRSVLVVDDDGVSRLILRQALAEAGLPSEDVMSGGAALAWMGAVTAVGRKRGELLGAATPKPWLDWATLLRRTYDLDVLACPYGGRLRCVFSLAPAVHHAMPPAHHAMPPAHHAMPTGHDASCPAHDATRRVHNAMPHVAKRMLVIKKKYLLRPASPPPRGEIPPRLRANSLPLSDPTTLCRGMVACRAVADDSAVAHRAPSRARGIPDSPDPWVCSPNTVFSRPFAA